MICKICGNIEENKVFKIREMMFGFRDKFTYFECSKCRRKFDVLKYNIDYRKRKGKNGGNYISITQNSMCENC